MSRKACREMRSEINKRAGQRRKAQMNMAAKSPIASPTNDQKRHAQLVKEARGKFKSESSSEESKKVHLWLLTLWLWWSIQPLTGFHFVYDFWTFQLDFEPNINFLLQIDKKLEFCTLWLCIQNGGQRQMNRHLWMKEGWDMWHSIDVKLSLCPSPYYT